MAYVGEARFRYEGPMALCVKYIRPARVLADNLMRQALVGGVTSATRTFRYDTGAVIRVSVWKDSIPTITIDVTAEYKKLLEKSGATSIEKKKPAGVCFVSNYPEHYVESDESPSHVLRMDGVESNYWTHKESSGETEAADIVYRILYDLRPVAFFAALQATIGGKREEAVGNPPRYSLVSQADHLVKEAIRLSLCFTHEFHDRQGRLLSVDGAMLSTRHLGKPEHIADVSRMTTWRMLSEEGDKIFVHTTMRDADVVGNPGGSDFVPYQYRWGTRGVGDGESGFVGSRIGQYLDFYIYDSSDYGEALSQGIQVRVPVSDLSTNNDLLGSEGLCVLPLDISSTGERFMVLLVADSKYDYHEDFSMEGGTCIAEIVIQASTDSSGKVVTAEHTTNILAEDNLSEEEITQVSYLLGTHYQIERRAEIEYTGEDTFKTVIREYLLQHKTINMSASEQEQSNFFQGYTGTNPNIRDWFYTVRVPAWVGEEIYSAPVFGYYGDSDEPIIDIAKHTRRQQVVLGGSENSIDAEELLKESGDRSYVVSGTVQANATFECMYECVLWRGEAQLSKQTFLIQGHSAASVQVEERHIVDVSRSRYGDISVSYEGAVAPAVVDDIQPTRSNSSSFSYESEGFGRMSYSSTMVTTDRFGALALWFPAASLKRAGLAYVQDKWAGDYGQVTFNYGVLIFGYYPTCNKCARLYSYSKASDSSEDASALGDIVTPTGVHQRYEPVPVVRKRQNTQEMDFSVQKRSSCYRRHGDFLVHSSEQPISFLGRVVSIAGALRTRDDEKQHDESISLQQASVGGRIAAGDYR